MKQQPVNIGPLKQTVKNGYNTLLAEVNGLEVYFKSSAQLTPSAEAFGSAFLLPAMFQNRTIQLNDQVCPTWADNTAKIRDIINHWWSLSGGEVQHTKRSTSIAPASGRGLFFGGGVDSFFTLMQQKESLTHLIYIEGYDTKLKDTDRLKKTRAWNQAISDACGLELLTIQTNLRTHPLIRKTDWLKTYGGALVAAAHVLGSHCNEVLMSGWGHVSDSRAQGSHPDLEPLWSSEQIRFSHYGEQFSRAEKMDQLSHWPLAHQYLRVCWQHHNNSMNCGQCEKCVRTQLECLAANCLQHMSSFPAQSLATAIDRLPGLSAHLAYNYQELLERIEEESTCQAIRALLERSVKWQQRERQRRKRKSLIKNLFLH